MVPPELILGTGEENFRPRCCVHTCRGFMSPFECSKAVFGQEGFSGQLARIFVLQTFWQTLQGRTCTCEYSDKLSCSYLEFKRLRKQLWEKRGIFLKKETLKGLGGFFSQFPLGDSCCSAIFFLCLVLMSSDGVFGLFCCFVMLFLFNFVYSFWAWAEKSWCFWIPWKLVGKEQAMQSVSLGFWYCGFFTRLISGIFSAKG